jgi:NADP-dependent 3-hydroxy acid dehydrogenase YdfG
MPTLNRKVAIIIGATSGIGARTAELFVQSGARVVLAGRRAAKVEPLAGPPASSMRAQATIFAKAYERFGATD